MDKQRTKDWAGVVMSAVVLGLAAFYFMHAWMPEKAMDWVLFAAVALIAVRSIMRIAALASKISRPEEDSNDEA